MVNKQGEIRPQEGFQMQFLSSKADVTIGGAAAGVGKSWALLVAPTRHLEVNLFTDITFRRTTEQIRALGGLWQKSEQLYPLVGLKPNNQQLEWHYKPKNIVLKFAHLQYEKNIYDHDGAEYALVKFDELQHFLKKQFIYMLSRNRSTCGIRPYVMATCNPDPDSFLATDLLPWWIDQDERTPEFQKDENDDEYEGIWVRTESSSGERRGTQKIRNKFAGERNPHWGLPIEERVGRLRYMMHFEDKFVWAKSKSEMIKKNPEIFSEKNMKGVNDPNRLIKSVTLITGNIQDNKALLDTDPGYLANLWAQDENERLRLLEGNWKIRGKDSCIFNVFSIDNMFSNYWPSTTSDRFITCDAARFGPDLATIFVWFGWKVAKLIILSSSEKDEIVAAIEKEREAYNIPKSKCIIDQDGVGGGVVRDGRYIGFHGGGPPMEALELTDRDGTKRRENYENLKTQCYYRLAEKVNEDSISLPLDSNNIVVNGNYSTKVKINGEVRDVRELIKEDMRAIRSKDRDKDGKKKINGKDEQKIILGGRSPDFSDGMMPRVYFDFRSGKINVASSSNVKKSLLDYITPITA